MLDHVSIGITDRQKSKTFYDAVLSTIGLTKVADYGETVAYGPSRKDPFFWLVEQADIGRSQGFHCAFRAPDRASIHAFHAAALANGGIDNGGPGKRDYEENYYAAFVLDPDGNKIEAVCFKPD
ncbi:VOC family protein [Sneathiella chungangensis]|uniref:VOC family protein n=1 Tax=Sneathiella chungangensis TaxID=1418234 RepID=A0A845MH93_9PROT|nr:VOC family protein [Sneathiella chungangensis]MZR23071.1 VOC family protein [Sneathiella chungangensis]